MKCQGKNRKPLSIANTKFYIRGGLSGYPIRYCSSKVRSASGGRICLRHDLLCFNAEQVRPPEADLPQARLGHYTEAQFLPNGLGSIKLAETFECADCRDMASAPTEAFVISPHFHICNCILLRVY